MAAALADQDAPDACKTDVVGSDDRGLERITVTSPCRHGEPVRAIYDGSVQQETFFSDDGVANLAIALTDARSPITLSYQDGSRETVAFAPGSFESLSTVFRVTLQWDLPVDLNLHVVEPGGSVNGKGDATAGHPPKQFGVNGRLDLMDDGKGSGPFQESYVFPNPPQRPAEVFTIRVENVSRGRTPAEPHCGAGKLAEVAFSLIIVDRGKVSRKSITLAPAACGQTLDDRTYYFKPRL